LAPSYNGRATSSAAPRAQSGTRHGLGTLALAEGRHVMALRAFGGDSLSPPPISVRGGSREVLGSVVPGRLSVDLVDGGGSVVAGRRGRPAKRARRHSTSAERSEAMGQPGSWGGVHDVWRRERNSVCDHGDARLV
jgi:hypothetical protein